MPDAPDTAPPADPTPDGGTPDPTPLPTPPAGASAEPTPDPAGETPLPEPDDPDLEPLPDAGTTGTVPYETAKKYREEAAARRVKLKQIEGQITEFGGIDRVEKAVQLHEHLTTEEGAVQVFFHLARSWGIPEAKVKELFEGEAGEEPDPERPLTAAEFKTWQEQQADEQRKAAQSVQAQGARKAISATLTELGLDESKTEDQQIIKSVLGYGSAYVKADEYDPDKVVEAVKKGFEDFKRVVAESSKKYLEDKKQQAAGAPSPLSGKAPGAGDTAPEPKNTAEAKARVRDLLKAGQI